MVKVLAAAGLSVLLTSSLFVSAQAQAPRSTPQPLAFPRADETTKQWAVIRDNCTGCHNGAAAPAGLDFEAMTPEDIARNPELFETVVRKVGARMMPPGGNSTLDDATVASFTGWVEDYLDYHSATSRPAAGQLSDAELAARLSAFLWGAGPDAELAGLAAQGRLREAGVLDAQARRMLADPKADALAGGFAFQWLHIPASGGASDPRGAMNQELKLFVGDVFRNNRSVVDLLTADDTYLNEDLAAHYGVAGVTGEAFRKVVLTQPQRRGLLGKGAVLTAMAPADRTQVVFRGAFILENILGAPPASPPPGVTYGEMGNMSRAQLGLHLGSPSCNVCHAAMDPLGLALQNFDATGAWRDEDPLTDGRIDASATLLSGVRINGVNDLRDQLAARPEPFVQTFTEKLAGYAVGRPMSSADMGVVRQVVRDAAQQDYAFDAIVLGLIDSDLFQRRSPAGDVRVAGEGPEVAAR